MCRCVCVRKQELNHYPQFPSRPQTKPFWLRLVEMSKHGDSLERVSFTAGWSDSFPCVHLKEFVEVLPGVVCVCVCVTVAHQHLWLTDSRDPGLGIHTAQTAHLGISFL